MRAIHKVRTLVAAVVILLSFGVNASLFAQAPPQRVRFAKGTHSTIVKGRIKGYATRDYVLGAKAGQTMSVKLWSANSYANFVIYSINGRPTDMNETQEWSEVLAETGDYVIRVFMVRAGARRPGAKADYSLDIYIQ